MYFPIQSLSTTRIRKAPGKDSGTTLQLKLEWIVKEIQFHHQSSSKYRPKITQFLRLRWTVTYLKICSDSWE
ncbi:unnamed protein product [Pseudo-nitzschia multistriata]|uniref:Uncharacterized protein n=1 Tax=Pseudo-nitzschia multistriata TaxID=183589 RepID=A0A448YXM9_9STRA|nr:unnamed protein product [Pseudo-nitzschia multistriata]